MNNRTITILSFQHRPFMSAQIKCCHAILRRIKEFRRRHIYMLSSLCFKSVRISYLFLFPIRITLNCFCEPSTSFSRYLTGILVHSSWPDQWIWVQFVDLLAPRMPFYSCTVNWLFFSICPPLFLAEMFLALKTPSHLWSTGMVTSCCGAAWLEELCSFSTMIIANSSVLCNLI